MRDEMQQMQRQLVIVDDGGAGGVSSGDRWMVSSLLLLGARGTRRGEGERQDLKKPPAEDAARLGGEIRSHAMACG